MFFQQAALLEHQQAKLIQEQIELQKAVSFSRGIALTITVLYHKVYVELSKCSTGRLTEANGRTTEKE